MTRKAPLIPVQSVIDDLSGFRRRLGVSLLDFKRAINLCQERPDYAGDFLMALAWVDASGLAISVKGDRAAWNDRSAAARIDGLFSHVDFEAADAGLRQAP